MEVKLERNLRKPEQMVARLGNGVIGFFHQPPYGREGDLIDVMICAHGKEIRADGYPKVVFLQQVDPAKDMLLHVHGFECSGSMCQTLAYAPAIGKCITPGKAPVYVADNVNCAFYRLPYYPKVAHKVWCRARVGKPHMTVGLDSLQDLGCYIRMTNDEYKKVKAAHAAHHQEFLDRIKAKFPNGEQS